MKRTRTRQLAIPLIALLLCAFLAGPVVNADWLNYGGDAGSHKYSPLDQINADNVKNVAGRMELGFTGQHAGCEGPELDGLGV